MIGLEQIITLIKQNGKYYLYLQMKQNAFRAVNVGSFTCANCDVEAKPEERLQKAVEWLTSFVEQFPAGTIFYLTMKSSPQANQSGVFGPIEFIGKKTETNTSEAINGMSALNMSPDTLRQQGYLTQGEVNAMLAEERMKHQAELHKRDMADMQKEFSEKLDFAVNSANKWSPENLTQLSANVAGLLGAITGKPVALAGVPESEPKKEKEPIDISLESLNDYLKENYNLVEIEQFKQALKQKNNERQKEQRIKPGKKE